MGQTSTFPSNTEPRRKPSTEPHVENPELATRPRYRAVLGRDRCVFKRPGTRRLLLTALSTRAAFRSRTVSRSASEITSPSNPITSREKRSRWSFCRAEPVSGGKVPVVDDLDPLPFVTDERYSRADGRMQVETDSVLGAGSSEDDSRLGRECLAIVKQQFGCDSSGKPTRETRGDRSKTEPVLVDVNLGGIALRVPRSIVPGTTLDLRFEFRGAEKAIEIRADVVRCGDKGERGCLIVCRLQRHLSFAEIHEIGRGLFASAIV